MIITIDGPAGSGKSTAARLLATRLGFFHLDTGAIYRSIAYVCIKNQISRLDEEVVTAIAKGTSIEFVKDGEDIRVIANGEDVSEKIRTPDVSLGASDVGRLRGVREALVDIQRKVVSNNNNVVAEGRDMGTVIFPYADLKFFLDASLEVRAKRRFLEFISKGIDIGFDDVLLDTQKRDLQDLSRDVAPLRPAEDAIVIDTSNMDVEDLLDYLLKETKKRWRL